jgi:tetratricopeptide (TPR) repeat protein
MYDNSHGSLSEIWNCPEAFEFICSKKWNELNSTDRSNIRHCEICNLNVYWSANSQEFIANSKLDRCVAVPIEGLPSDFNIVGRVSSELNGIIQNRKIQYEKWRNDWKLVLSEDPSFILFLIRKGYPDALDMFVELAGSSIVNQDLLDRSYQLLANSQEKDRFGLYLIEIGRFDLAIEILRASKDSSSLAVAIGKLIRMDKIEESLKVLPHIISSRQRFISTCAIGDKMVDLGQTERAIELYESYLNYTRQDFTEVETNISQRLSILHRSNVNPLNSIE